MTFEAVPLPEEEEQMSWIHTKARS